MKAIQFASIARVSHFERKLFGEEKPKKSGIQNSHSYFEALVAQEKTGWAINCYQTLKSLLSPLNPKATMAWIQDESRGLFLLVGQVADYFRSNQFPNQYVSSGNSLDIPTVSKTGLAMLIGRENEQAQPHFVDMPFQVTLGQVRGWNAQPSATNIESFTPLTEGQQRVVDPKSQWLAK